MPSQKETIVSAMRPTGQLHLGHYFGVLRNWKKLQDTAQCYFFVADWHSLTTEYAHPEIVAATFKEMVADWLACGIDPKKAVLFVQSQVKEHAELHLLLSMITPLGWLERVPSYKELQNELKGKDLSTYGFLGYPLLQTADVALYKATQVPVGQDQVAHIELSREIVRRFNFLYGTELFPEPQSLLAPTPKIVGLDGRKMSKSYQNCIYLADTAEETEKKMKVCIMDPARKRRTDPGNPEVCPVYFLHKEVSSSSEIEMVVEGCRTAGMGCTDCKKVVIKNLNKELEPIREKRAVHLKSGLDGILEEGKAKARKVATQTMEQVRVAMRV